MLGHAKCKNEIAELGIGRRSLAHHLEHHVIDQPVVARLHQQAAGNRFHHDPARARIRQPAGEQQAQVLLGADDCDRLLAGLGRDDDFGEDLGDRARGFGVKLAIHRHNAAERRYRIAGERLAVRIEQIFAFGHAARIGVLDDHAGGAALRIELGEAFVGRVGVVEIVVGELLAL